MYKKLYTRTTYHTPECITEKLDTHSFSGFLNYMNNNYIQNYNENCLVENCYICQN